MHKEIYLAGGCFWGLEKFLQDIPGVIKTEVGYANGNTENPSYEDVCKRKTGHAETVFIQYDPALIKLQTLLELYYRVIDPVSVNRQGMDFGSQYRTGIYYKDDTEIEIIKASLEKLQEKYREKLAIELVPLENYWPAEDYHQKYLDKNPGGYCHISSATMDNARRILTQPIQPIQSSS